MKIHPMTKERLELLKDLPKCTNEEWLAWQKKVIREEYVKGEKK